jgi:hypothetical protein
MPRPRPITKPLMWIAGVLTLLAIPSIVIAQASDRFTDIDDDNVFAEDIDAIAAAGVTRGCTDTLYCPEDYVTREQMAAFMNRLGAIGAGEEPVADARTVQGLAVHADIIEIEVNNQENNEEECEPTTSLLGPGHPFGTFFITYQLLGTPDSVFTFDVNVAASDRSPEGVDETGEFLICFAMTDSDLELPDGTYTLFAIEAHEMAPLAD